MLTYITLFLAKDISSQTDDELRHKAFVFWQGTRSEMTIKELVSYCAPIFWYSSDEPSLRRAKGKSIMIPQNFPFQKSNGKPVVYYQARYIITKEKKKQTAFERNRLNIDSSIVHLDQLNGVEIDFNHYYEFEAGLGTHHHDTEQSQFKVFVRKHKTDSVKVYQLILIEVTGKAHALPWYDNIFSLDVSSLETELPFHILVEEGKHASCTDMNGDGYYTPGYDVNLRKNDAWGLRDVIRSGDLFTSDYQSFMSKVRKPEYKVLPPLPPDSPHRWKYTKDGVYAPDNAVYELRPMPDPKNALPDKGLEHDMKGYYNRWPKIDERTTKFRMTEWWETNQFIKSIAIMARFNKEIGFSVSFPLLLVQNVETPIIGGWMVNRIYFQDKNLRDFGYNILLTPSASRFMDPYFAAGVEVDKDVNDSTGATSKRTDFVLETGLKFRANVLFSPLKFLSFLSDFWGVRIGIKNKGFWDINQFSYVLEIGAGVW